MSLCLDAPPVYRNGLVLGRLPAGPADPEKPRAKLLISLALGGGSAAHQGYLTQCPFFALSSYGTSISRFTRTWLPANTGYLGCACTPSKTTTGWSSCWTSFPPFIRP